MDLIHRLYNLVSHYKFLFAQTQQEDVKRNWLELPADVMSLIFLKLGAVNILGTAQWVCTSWWKLSKQPHLFRCIHVDEVFILFGHSISLNRHFKLGKEMTREAIDRSCGQLVEFFVRVIADDEILHYMAERSSSLRCFRLVNVEDSVTDDGLIEIAKKFPQLEELEIGYPNYYLNDVFETFGRFCPRIKSARFIGPCYHTTGLALVIAKTMTELRHLIFFGNRMTDDDLKAILDGCPHLESLDLRKCDGLKLAGDLEKRCGNLKVIRLPKDPTDLFEYELNCYCNHDFLEYESD